MTKSRRRWYLHALIERVLYWVALVSITILCCVDWDATLTNFGF